MKNILGSILLGLILLAIVSCSKTEDTHDTISDCAGVACRNGASCASGTCQCLEPWTGVDCSQQKMPSKISFRRLKITELPATNGGMGWDSTGVPDVYAVVKQNGNVIGSTKSLGGTYVVQGVVRGWKFDDWLMIDPTSQIEVEVWDYDDVDSDDFMGSASGTIYNSTNRFPVSVDIACDNCIIEFRIEDVKYFFNVYLD